MDGRTVDAVNRLTEDAVTAVSASVDEPESDARLVAACEAIAAAHDGIERATAGLSPEPAGRAATLRRKAARILFERIRGGRKER